MTPHTPTKEEGCRALRKSSNSLIPLGMAALCTGCDMAAGADRSAIPNSSCYFRCEECVFDYFWSSFTEQIELGGNKTPCADS